VNRFLACIILSLVLLSGIAFAAPKPTEPDERNLVSAVDIVKRTIEITHQGHHITTKYLLAPDATIEIDDKSAKIKDVKVGMVLHLCTFGSGMDDPQIIEDLDLKQGLPPPK
jgi:hypothetical protein